MKVVQTTEADAESLRAIVDKALDYPKRGGYVGAGRRLRPIPETWDGQGETPFGWTTHHVPLFVVSVADAWLPLDDGTVAACATSGILTGQEKAAIASSGRSEVADPTQGGARPVKPRASLPAQSGSSLDIKPGRSVG